MAHFPLNRRHFHPAGQFVGSHRVLAHHQREGSLPLRHACLRCHHDTGNLRFLRRKGQPGNLDGIQELMHDAAHLLVLRFVFDARLAPPRGDEQGGNAKRIIERRQWIDHVAKPGVLAHRHGLASGQGSAQRDTDCFAFAGGAHVIQGGVVHDVVDERLQERTRHTRVERIVQSAKRLDEG
jgi:hypothetical protein